MADETVVIRQSRGKAALGVAIAAAMLGMCIWLLFQGEPHSAKGAFARYVATPIFGVLTLIWLKSFLFPASLVLSPEGLQLRLFPGGFRLGWAEIASAAVINPWFVEKITITTTAGKKRNLPAAWTLPPKGALQAVLDAKAQWEGRPAQAPAPSQAAIVS